MPPLDCLDVSMGIDVDEESCLLIAEATRLSRTGSAPSVPNSVFDTFDTFDTFDMEPDMEPDMAKNGDGCCIWLFPGAANPPTATISSSRQDMHRLFESFLAVGLDILDTDSVFTPTSVTFDALYGTFVRVMGIKRPPTANPTPRRLAMESRPRNRDLALARPARLESDCSQILEFRGTEAIWCSSRLRKIVKYANGEASCPGQRPFASSTTRCSDGRVHSTHFRQEPRS